MAKMEQLSLKTFSKEEKEKILKELTNVEAFNAFLNDKLKTSKRFGVEGICSMIAGISKDQFTQMSWLKLRPTEELNILDLGWLIEVDWLLFTTILTSLCKKYLLNSKKMLITNNKWIGGTQEMLNTILESLLRKRSMTRMSDFQFCPTRLTWRPLTLSVWVM